MLKKSKFDWMKSASAARNAAAVLPKLASDFLSAGRQLTQAASSPETIHQFRLQIKRFRYTLELFGPCYGPSLEKRLEDLRQLQQILGDLNDCAATLQLFVGGKYPELQDQQKLFEYLETSIGRKTREFMETWEKLFGSPTGAHRWVNYFTRTRGVTRARHRQPVRA